MVNKTTLAPSNIHNDTNKSSWWHSHGICDHDKSQPRSFYISYWRLSWPLTLFCNFLYALFVQEGKQLIHCKFSLDLLPVALTTFAYRSAVAINIISYDTIFFHTVSVQIDILLILLTCTVVVLCPMWDTVSNFKNTYQSFNSLYIWTEKKS